jgi:hypothetical protein
MGSSPVRGSEMRVCAATEKAAKNSMSAKMTGRRLLSFKLFRSGMASKHPCIN